MFDIFRFFEEKEPFLAETALETGYFPNFQKISPKLSGCRNFGGK